MIRNNVFEQIERIGFTISLGPEDVEIDHNTFVPTKYAPFFVNGLKGHDESGKMIGLPCPRFKFTNNILGFARGGPEVDRGKNTLAEAFPGGIWGGNLLVGGGETEFQKKKISQGFPPAGFLFEPQQTGNGSSGDAVWSAVGFVNYAGGDYRLAKTSKYKAAGTDGKPLGADIDAIEAAMRKAQ